MGKRSTLYKNCTKERNIWHWMMYRCYNPNRPAWKYYGARGITVSKEWHDFWVFLKDLGPCPEGYSLERKDNNSGYCKENCCWLLRKLQTKNTRRSRFITIGNRTELVSEWCVIADISKQLFYHRCRQGLTVEEALFTPRAYRHDLKKRVANCNITAYT